MRNDLEPVPEYKNITLIPLGRHTRLGDALEYALEGIPFDTVSADALTDDARGCRILFAASADALGENTQMRALAARLAGGRVSLEGCHAAMIADAEQGGAMHLDALRLLLAANAAGAAILPHPLVEAGRDLRALPRESGETPFARYRALARELVRRLASVTNEPQTRSRVRFVTVLGDGIANDWRIALSRIVPAAGGILCDEEDADETVLLCENAEGLPDGDTLALLGGGGLLCLLIASPATGNELYTSALIERACIRGNYALPPRAVTVFEGFSAAEALTDKRGLERMKAIFPKKHTI